MGFEQKSSGKTGAVHFEKAEQFAVIEFRIVRRCRTIRSVASEMVESQDKEPGVRKLCRVLLENEHRCAEAVNEHHDRCVFRSLDIVVDRSLWQRDRLSGGVFRVSLRRRAAFR